MEIHVANRTRAAGVDAESVRGLVRDLAGALRVRRGCSVVFVGDARMRAYNRYYRATDRSTDVLSFPSESDEYAGDIVVSLPRAMAQARAAGRPVDEELRWLITHGYLHLLGYDHETDQGQMRRRERKAMAVVRPRRLLSRPR